MLLARMPTKSKIVKMLETERLIIRPLNYEQLLKYLKSDQSLEAELKVNHTPIGISADLKEAFEEVILPNVADKSKNYLFSTLWTGISKTENKMVGDLCIYGEPNAAGEIEFGYGTHDEFLNQGYMTELVGGIIAWVKTQTNVKAMIASTEKTNIASFKILKKNEFKKVGQSDTLFTWKLKMIEQ
jgi:[ribosomal protein S5]-alanine N-acetyltransferase